MLSIESSDMKQALETTQREIHTLKDRLQTSQDELRQAEANVSQLKRKYKPSWQQHHSTEERSKLHPQQKRVFPYKRELKASSSNKCCLDYSHSVTVRSKL
ncbi:hypothetical protein E2C01_078653 [Portunus trituberculatus]|uniref:Uncharacterized protein n=1 Tax=Portunus trituberculatus TaxID=210409 RepID=A0A5B7IHG4_PORTR|nr:hypothetical protein [Portunus trituberculatus]